MASLGEACSHVGAVLFYMETSTKMNSTACTQQKCQWIIPNYQKDIPYLPVKDMDFSSSTEKKRNIYTSKLSTSSVSSDISSVTQHTSTSHTVCNVLVRKPDDLEKKNFFQILSMCGTKPGILTFEEPYSDNYNYSKGSAAFFS